LCVMSPGVMSSDAQVLVCTYVYILCDAKSCSEIRLYGVTYVYIPGTGTYRYGHNFKLR
jgi:hypothetical protein